MKYKFLDLQAQQQRIQHGITSALQKVLEHNQYIGGPEVSKLEQELAEFCGAKHAITCANGTDALILLCASRGLTQDSVVFMPTFTFAATAEAVKHTGGTIMFVDVLPDTFNIDPNSLKLAVLKARQQGLTPAGVITVDLFGQPADYDSIESIVDENGLWLVCDSAQSFGARYKNKNVGTIGLATSTSFFPSKPLGCYGDGGCIFTNDDELNYVLRSMKNHGQSNERYEYIRVGFNSRLDTIQAAVLLEKLKIFPEELKRRAEIATQYNYVLKDLVTTPKIQLGCTSTYAVYTILLNTNSNRDYVRRELDKYGIPTAVYYPKPLHAQPAYKDCLTASTNLSVSEAVAKRVLSLPMHPYLEMTDDYLNVLTDIFSLAANPI